MLGPHIALNKSCEKAGIRSAEVWLKFDLHFEDCPIGRIKPPGSLTWLRGRMFSIPDLDSLTFSGMFLTFFETLRLVSRQQDCVRIRAGYCQLFQDMYPDTGSAIQYVS